MKKLTAVFFLFFVDYMKKKYKTTDSLNKLRGLYEGSLVSDEIQLKLLAIKKGDSFVLQPWDLLIVEEYKKPRSACQRLHRPCQRKELS